MASRDCTQCDISWPAAEVYKTTFGSAASRATNEICPICGTTTRYQLAGEPDDPATIDDILEARQHAVRRDAARVLFEQHYMDREMAKFCRELDTWPTAPA